MRRHSCTPAWDMCVGNKIDNSKDHALAENRRLIRSIKFHVRSTFGARLSVQEMWKMHDED
jgi:hypothetical protein